MEENPTLSRKPHPSFRFRPVEEVELRSRWEPKMFAEVKVEKINWFWYPYVPVGRLTILGGDPGQGKSFITTAIAAAASRGEDLPGDFTEHEPRNTLMLSAEDDPGDTIKPRLINLNADQRRIFVNTDYIPLDADGIAGIREMVDQTDAKLLTIDPIVAYLGARMDMNRANEVRPIMKSLADIARDKQIAIIVVRHNRKVSAGGKEGKAIYAGQGSIDFTAAVRSELQVGEAKNGRRYLNHIKTNAGPIGKSINYTIDDGIFHWGDMVEVPAEFASGGPTISRKFKNEATIRQWLFDELTQMPDGDLAKNIIAKGQMAGHSQTKLEHVKRGVAVSAKRGQEWYWVLDPRAISAIAHDEDGVVV